MIGTQPVWAALVSGRRGGPVGRAVWLGIAVAMSGALLLALTLGPQLLGHSSSNRVLATVGATAVSMLILLEIPGAALVAALFLDQTPPLPVVPAAVLLLAGLAMVIRAGSGGSVPAVPVE